MLIYFITVESVSHISSFLYLLKRSSIFPYFLIALNLFRHGQKKSFGEERIFNAF